MTYTNDVVGKLISIYCYRFKSSNITINKDILEDKWIVLKDLIVLMCNNDTPDKRPTCDEIINEKYQWSIEVGDISYFGLDEPGIMSNITGDFFPEYFGQKMRSFEGFDKRFKKLKDIGKGCYGSLFNVEQIIDKKMYTIKKILNGILL